MGQGDRIDVKQFQEKLKSGADDLELMDFDFGKYARFIKTVDRYRTYIAPRRETELEVYLLIGKPGTGKTRSVYEKCPGVWAFPIGKDLWCDGYRGQPDVLLDDFSGQMRLVDTLRLLDRYPIQIPKKGGFSWWCPQRIFITTNIHPRYWYDWSKRPDQQLALRRRIHHFIDFDDFTEDEDTTGPVELPMEEAWYIPDGVIPLSKKQLKMIDGVLMGMDYTEELNTTPKKVIEKIIID